MMTAKKLFFHVCFLAAAVCSIAQQAAVADHTLQTSTSDGTYPEQTEAVQAESRINELSPVFSGFKFVSHYYGLPLTAAVGWFYRNTDTSVYPHTGISFDVDTYPAVSASAGLTVQKKWFTWYGAVLYDLIPFTLNKGPNEQLVYGKTVFGFRLPRVHLGFPLRAGKRQIARCDTAGNPVPAKEAVTELSAGIQLDVFLLDAGIFRCTAQALFTYHIIPEAYFQYYTFKAGIPATFNLYYADIGFMYSVLSTRSIGEKTARQHYATARTQDAVTGRSSFRPLQAYQDVHFFSTEFRWYPARLTSSTNGFFVSLFADTGFGVTARSALDFLWECGAGLGYTLFDSVPFTFQAGINQNMQPVFYITAVSRIAHLP